MVKPVKVKKPKVAKKKSKLNVKSNKEVVEVAKVESPARPKTPLQNLVSRPNDDFIDAGIMDYEYDTYAQHDKQSLPSGNKQSPDGNIRGSPRIYNLPNESQKLDMGETKGKKNKLKSKKMGARKGSKHSKKITFTDRLERPNKTMGSDLDHPALKVTTKHKKSKKKCHNKSVKDIQKEPLQKLPKVTSDVINSNKKLVNQDKQKRNVAVSSRHPTDDILKSDTANSLEPQLEPRNEENLPPELQNMGHSQSMYFLR